MRFSRRVAIALAAITLLLALAPSALATDPPVVTNGTVTPTSVTYLGGTVTVSAQVSDDSGLLNDVFVEVSGPYYFPVALSQGPGTNEWTGTVELPPNYTPNPVTWRFDVLGRDTELQDGVGFAGEVRVDAEPAVDNPPSVYDPEVTPRILSSTGGPFELGVSATDLFGIAQVYATITGPSGATIAVLNSIGADRFTGVFNAPVNLSLFPVQYSISMTALDERSQPSTVDAGLITVAGKTGLLKVAPTSLSFETVKVGSRARKSFVLRNDGKKPSGPVSGLLVAPAAPFYLVGAGATGIPFTLAAGEAKTFTVEFRAATMGIQRGTAALRRNDNGQLGFAMPLSGRAVSQK
ncbi:MAG: hypothetical protein ACJ8JD_12320 [Chthoniobacterales bacterium]